MNPPIVDRDPGDEQPQNPWRGEYLGFWTDGEYGRGGGEFVTASQVWEDGYNAAVSDFKITIASVRERMGL